MVANSQSRIKQLRFITVIAFSSIIFSITAVAAPIAHDHNNDYRQLDLFSNVLFIVRKNYVDPVSMDKLMHGAIRGMLSELDPHSAYMTPEMLLELDNETTGQFSGIGIDITVRDHMITVIAPIADTPAARAGIKAGDKIIKIDGKYIKDMVILDAINMMRGALGETITLTIMREPDDQPLQFTLTREIVHIASIKQHNYINGLGYIRISEFQEHTRDDLATALTQLTKNSGGKLNGLVLDLRNNPGGLFEQAIKVADLFLDSGDIVSTKGLLPEDNRVYRAHQSGTVQGGNFPIIILVNSGSASAAEIVAGALQDNNRAVVLGTKTFGKGSVQSIIPLDDSSALRLTTARYYTPNGTSIQARGINPDIVAPQVIWSTSPDNTLTEKDLDNHLQAVDNELTEHESNTPPADYQLNRALDLLIGWQKFGTSEPKHSTAGDKTK